MNDTSPDSAKAAKAELTASEKHGAKLWNERIKLSVTLLHSLALAVLGLGALRFIFDPIASRPENWIIGAALIFSLALEASAFYVIGRMKPEN